MGGIWAGLWSDDATRYTMLVGNCCTSEGMGIPHADGVHHSAVRLLPSLRTDMGAFRYTCNISGIPESRIHLKGDRKWSL